MYIGRIYESAINYKEKIEGAYKYYKYFKYIHSVFQEYFICMSNVFNSSKSSISSVFQCKTNMFTLSKSRI